MKLAIDLKRSFYFLIIAVLFLALIPLVKGKSAEIDPVSLEISKNFQMIEHSLKRGNDENVSSIDISLPSDTWSIDDIEFHFNRMEFGA